MFFAPLKCRTLVKIFKIPKSTKKWVSMRPPPLFFTWNFFYQNYSKCPKMDFKPNFKKCNILSAGPNYSTLGSISLIFFLFLNMVWIIQKCNEIFSQKCTFYIESIFKHFWHSALLVLAIITCYNDNCTCTWKTHTKGFSNKLETINQCHPNLLKSMESGKQIMIIKRY